MAGLWLQEVGLVSKMLLLTSVLFPSQDNMRFSSQNGADMLTWDDSNLHGTQDKFRALKI